MLEGDLKMVALAAQDDAIAEFLVEHALPGLELAHLCRARHAIAKDGINLQPFDAELLYNPPADHRGVPSNWADYFREVPLGEGQVDFPAYLAALKKARLSDLFFTIEREVGPDHVNDIRKAVDFLRQQAGSLN